MSVEFGSLFDFIRNGMSVKQDKAGAGLPISRIETIADARVDPLRVGYAGLSEEECEGWLLQPGDILFSHINSVDHIGKCAVYRGVPEKLVHGMNLLCLRPNQQLVDPEFAKYLIRGQDFKSRLANFVNKAVNQASVSIGNMKPILVVVPGLGEQRRIAAILDQAETLRCQRRSALAQLDSLTQSIFLDMFGDPVTNPKGWNFARLDQLVRADDTINYGVIQPGDALEEGVPLVRVGDVVDGNFDPQSLKRIALSIEAPYKRSRLRGDEILVTCVGSIGVVALVDASMSGFNIARAVSRIPLSEKMDRVFVASYLQTDYVQRYFTSELRTVSQPTLNIKQICETKVIQPPLPLQRTFATRIQAIESLKTTHRAALAELDALFASLQQRAFAGEL